mgnify:CR=1 FL=1
MLVICSTILLVVRISKIDNNNIENNQINTQNSVLGAEKKVSSSYAVMEGSRNILLDGQNWLSSTLTNFTLFFSLTKKPIGCIFTPAPLAFACGSSLSASYTLPYSPPPATKPKVIFDIGTTTKSPFTIGFPTILLLSTTQPIGFLVSEKNSVKFVSVDESQGDSKWSDLIQAGMKLIKDKK